MDRTKQVFLIIGVIVLIAAGVIGYGQWERYSTEKRLVGLWAQQNVLDVLSQSLKEDPDGPQIVDDAPAEDSIPLDVPMGEMDVADGLAIDLNSSIRFREDHRFSVFVGEREFHGRWSLSKAGGKDKTVIARVMQTETFEQRLIIHFRFDGKDAMVLSDEAGLNGRFVRVE